jgi:hypothetical protein
MTRDEAQACGQCECCEAWRRERDAALSTPAPVGEAERLREALTSAQKFIEYARHELQPKLRPFAQFPSQECADKELAKITAALASPAPVEPPPAKGKE